jgi:hypothetical protein
MTPTANPAIGMPRPETHSETSSSVRERLVFIDFRCTFLGELRRADLMQRFGIGSAAATRDIAQYRGAMGGQDPARPRFEGTGFGCKTPRSSMALPMRILLRDTSLKEIGTSFTDRKVADRRVKPPILLRWPQIMVFTPYGLHTIIGHTPISSDFTSN